MTIKRKSKLKYRVQELGPKGWRYRYFRTLKGAKNFSKAISWEGDEPVDVDRRTKTGWRAMHIKPWPITRKRRRKTRKRRSR